jgi:hypothetical protein
MMKNKNAMMSDFIAEQEKTIWMMQAAKNNELSFQKNKRQNA